MRIPFFCLIAAGGLALGGCAYGDLGYGGLSVGVGSSYGSPYYGYGYGSPYGYGNPYGIGYGYGSSYGSGYGSPYFGYGYGSAYGGYPYGGVGYSSPYFGWYDGYYYPGVGSYGYDSYRRPRTLSVSQQRWSTHRKRATASGTAAPSTPQWSGFEQRSDRPVARRERHSEAAPDQRSD